MSAVPSILGFERISFGYRAARLFESFDLDIASGEMAAILGPNGSGKTTLVRLASGYLRPASGSIALEGRDSSALAARERARIVAVVPQETHLAFDFTVREVVLMGRAPHLGLLGIESAADREIARQAMEETGIGALADRPFRSLSGGERQLAVVARALAQRPRLLLLDEPTAFLDLKHRLTIYRLLTVLNRREGITVVVVSHDVDLAARHCDRIVLLRRGEIAADGSPEAVLTPSNLRAVYEVEARVGRDPETGRPQVVPLQ